MYIYYTCVFAVAEEVRGFHKSKDSDAKKQSIKPCSILGKSGNGSEIVRIVIITKINGNDLKFVPFTCIFLLTTTVFLFDVLIVVLFVFVAK